jgi:ABC-type antimicrobial peptide transport system permease subunit
MAGPPLEVMVGRTLKATVGNSLALTVGTSLEAPVRRSEMVVVGKLVGPFDGIVVGLHQKVSDHNCEAMMGLPILRSLLDALM